MVIYNLSEYQTFDIIDYKLTEDERLYLTEIAGGRNEIRFSWRELKDGLQFSFTSWVGVIQLQHMVINIRPKFDPDFRGLLSMLSYARGNHHFTTPKATSYRSGTHLLEIITELLCNEINILFRQGIYKEYINLQDDLSVLRGRPNLRRQLTINCLSPNKIACCFDELVTDIPENRVIRKALENARRLKLPKDLLFRVHHHLGLFREVCETDQVEFPISFSYNRLNEHYRHCHELCRLLIQSLGTGELFIREEKGFFTLLIDMNTLFEDFITRLIASCLPLGWSIKPRSQKADAIQLETGQSYRHIIPDILLTNPEGKHSIIDTKYKLYDQRPVDTSDIFQLAFYAQSFKTRDENGYYQACIIYPSDEKKEPESIILQLNRSVEAYKGRLKIFAIDLAAIVRAIEGKDRGYLSDLVGAITDECVGRNLDQGIVVT